MPVSKRSYANKLVFYILRVPFFVISLKLSMSLKNEQKQRLIVWRYMFTNFRIVKKNSFFEKKEKRCTNYFLWKSWSYWLGIVTYSSYGIMKYTVQCTWICCSGSFPACRAKLGRVDCACHLQNCDRLLFLSFERSKIQLYPIKPPRLNG